MSGARLLLGVCSIAALDLPLEHVADAAAAAGCDGVEITARPPHLGPDAPLAAVRAAGEGVRAHGLRVLAYGSYLGTRAHPRTRAAAEGEVARAAALGAPLLRVWAESDAQAEDEGLGRTVELLTLAADAGSREGVGLVVERHLGSLADTPERVERLLAALEPAGVALNYQTLDLLPMPAAAAQPEDARRLIRHARYVHLKNYRPPEGDGDRMLHGGSLEDGVLDCGALLEAMLAEGYEGPMSIEFVSSEPVPFAEKLARDVAFVRRRLAEART